jgi:hypothetical protein
MLIQHRVRKGIQLALCLIETVLIDNTARLLDPVVGEHVQDLEAL